MELMQVFASEKADGLAELIQKNNSVKFVSQLEQINSTVPLDRLMKMAIASLQRSEATNVNQADLFYLDTILTTVGWNKNDDVFDRIETWNARSTAEDKPFNLEHNPRQIIGHVVGNRAVDDSYNTIADDTAIDQLPDKFHILASCVIYKHLKSKDEELSEATATMIDEIKNGEWYVSMEALFTNFNYAMVTAGGEELIIPRTEESAFLSKYLRAYGGKGYYDGNKIGRAMSGLFFSGNGLVRKPANPESIIFASSSLPEVTKFRGTKASVSVLTPNTKGRNLMTEQELLNKVAQLEARLKAMDEEKVHAKISGLEAAVASEKETVAAKDKALADAQAALTAKETELAAAKDASTKLEVQVKEATEAKQAVETELTSLKLEAAKANRKADLVGKGVEATKADELVTKFSAFDDEQFASIAELAVEAAKKPKNDDDADDKNKNKADAAANDDEDATKKGMKKGNGLKGAAPAPGSVSCSDVETDPAQNVTTAEEVAATPESEEATLATQGSETEANGELISSIASYLGERVRKYPKGQRN